MSISRQFHGRLPCRLQRHPPKRHEAEFPVFAVTCQDFVQHMHKACQWALRALAIYELRKLHI